MIEATDTLTVMVSGSPALVYHKGEVPPPAGANPLFARSGFIHPLRTPSGAEVTSIHSPSHTHHFGLWHAWVNARHRGREVDFWNLKKGLATVRFVETVKLLQDSNSAGFVVRQAHVALAHDDQPEEVVLDETLRVVLRQDGAGYVIDYEFSQRNVTDAVLEFPAYRYGGGIAYRSPLAWGKENSDYLSSEGKTREDGHTTRSRWIAMHGPAGAGEGTVVILGHPSNRDAPQRMRVWPNGPIFFNYVPAQETAWSIEPGTEATMRYRILVQDGGPDVPAIEGQWDNYTN